MCTISLFPHLHTPSPSFSPSLIYLVVSVDVKHRDFLRDLSHEPGDCLHARDTHLPPFSSIRRFLIVLNSGRCTGDSSQQDVIKVKAFSGTSSSCGM